MSTPALRIGDAERTAVDRRLQEAAGAGLLTLAEYEERSGDVWAARTQDDLDVVVADLPLPAGTATPAPTGAPGRLGGLGRPKSRWGVAVMSEHRTAGPVAPRQRTNAVAVMGSTVIDLRRTDLPPVVDVRATAFMGDAKVLVPVGARVEANGLSVMGSREERLEPAAEGAPLVRIRGTAVMGSIEIGHGRPSERVAVGAQPVRLSKREARDARRDLARPGHRGRSPVKLVGAAVLVVGVVAGGSAVALHRQDDSAVFGSSVYVVPANQTDVHVGVLFGSEKVVLPPGYGAELGGRVVFGSKEIKEPFTGGPAGIVHIHAAGGFGSVEVLSQDQYEAEKSDR